MVKVKITKEVGDKVRFNNEACEVIDVNKDLGMIEIWSNSSKMYFIYESQLQGVK